MTVLQHGTGKKQEYLDVMIYQMTSLKQKSRKYDPFTIIQAERNSYRNLVISSSDFKVLQSKFL